MYGLGATSVPQTKTQVDPLVGLRSTVYSISESRVGLFGDGTDVRSMWATLGVGLVACRPTARRASPRWRLRRRFPST